MMRRAMNPTSALANKLEATMNAVFYRRMGIRAHGRSEAFFNRSMGIRAYNLLQQFFKRRGLETATEKEKSDALAEAFETTCLALEKLTLTDDLPAGANAAVETLKSLTDLLIQRAREPIDKFNPGRVTLYLPQETQAAALHYQNTPFVFPLSQILTIVWDELQQNSHPTTAATAAEDAQHDRKLKILSFIQALLYIQSQSGISHQGIRHILLEITLKQDDNILQSEPLAVHKIIGLALKKYIETCSLDAENLQQAILAWLDLDDATPLFNTLDNETRQQLRTELDTCFIQHGSQPLDVDTLTTYLGYLPFPEGETNETRPWEYLRTLLQATTTSPLPALTTLQAWIKEDYFKHPEGMTILRCFYTYYIAFTKLNTFAPMLLPLGIYEKEDEGMLRKTCDDFFEQHALSIPTPTTPFLPTAQCAPWLAAISRFHTDTHLQTIANFFAIWFVEKADWHTQAPLYGLLLQPLFREKVQFIVTQLASLKRNSDPDGALPLSPTELNAIFLHAILTSPQQWDPAFMTLFTAAKTLVETLNPERDPSHTALQQTYAQLLPQLSYLFHEARGGETPERPKQMILLPEQIKTIQEWAGCFALRANIAEQDRIIDTYHLSIKACILRELNITSDADKERYAPILYNKLRDTMYSLRHLAHQHVSCTRNILRLFLDYPMTWKNALVLCAAVSWPGNYVYTLRPDYYIDLITNNLISLHSTGLPAAFPELAPTMLDQQREEPSFLDLSRSLSCLHQMGVLTPSSSPHLCSQILDNLLTLRWEYDDLKRLHLTGILPAHPELTPKVFAQDMPHANVSLLSHGLEKLHQMGVLTSASSLDFVDQTLNLLLNSQCNKIYTLVTALQLMYSTPIPIAFPEIASKLLGYLTDGLDWLNREMLNNFVSLHSGGLFLAFPQYVSKILDLFAKKKTDHAYVPKKLADALLALYQQGVLSLAVSDEPGSIVLDLILNLSLTRRSSYHLITALVALRRAGIDIPITAKFCTQIADGGSRKTWGNAGACITTWVSAFPQYTSRILDLLLNHSPDDTLPLSLYILYPDMPNEHISTIAELLLNPELSATANMVAEALAAIHSVPHISIRYSAAELSAQLKSAPERAKEIAESFIARGRSVWATATARQVPDENSALSAGRQGFFPPPPETTDNTETRSLNPPHYLFRPVFGIDC